MQIPIITIRRAQAGDNILLCALGRKTFFETFASENTPADMQAYLSAAFSAEKQAAELADADTLFLIAEIEGQPAGYARLRAGFPEKPLNCLRPLEIVRFYACQEWLGLGVGPRLMQACLDEATLRDCDALWLDVWEHNPRAIAFYRKWGFKVVGTQSFLLGSDRQTDLLMQRAVENLAV
jgi:ribosomal protein S18 acetylase RimI-like enzyme